MFIALATVALAPGGSDLVGAVGTAHAAGRTTVYVDGQYHYSFTYPTAWTVRPHIPLYERALWPLSHTGMAVGSPDQNAWLLVVVGQGTYTPARLRAMEHDALTQMVQTAPFGITYSRRTVRGVTYQCAHTYGSWHDIGAHIAIADQLFLATSRGSTTYVFAFSVTLRTSMTKAQETQVLALLNSLVVS